MHECSGGGGRFSADGLSAMLQAGWWLVPIPIRSLNFLHFTQSIQPHHGPGFTKPLKEVPENLSGSEARPARNAYNLTAICEPIVYKMWSPRHLTTL
jgi:hypothetical protein